ncbi:Scr1 family TA system antitoxin-like transcriptional regulator [Saccharopolyspora sp. NPDC002376]
MAWLSRRDDPGVVYIENQKGGLYLEEPSEIAGFHEEFARLEERALSPADKTKFLTELVEDAES